MNRILGLIFFAIISLSSFAQGEIGKQRTLNGKVFFGGGIGLQFGTYTGIEISPIVGYRPIDNLYTGVRFTYQYIGGSGINYSQNVFGGSVFAKYILFDRLIAHVEYEGVHVWTSGDSFENYTDWYGTPLIGGGLYQKLGARSGMELLFLFDVSGSTNSIYSNPIIRLSFIL